MPRRDLTRPPASHRAIPPAPASVRPLLFLALLGACGGGGGGGGSGGAPFGLDAREPLAALALGSGVAAPALLVSEPAFPALALRTVQVASAGDGSGTLYALEQPGRVVAFDDDPGTSAAAVFLDVTDRVSQAGGEEGLLGIAFHPSFAANRTFYLCYTTSGPLRSRVSRFVAPPPGMGPVDPLTETVLLEFDRPAGFHCGGSLAFGPDGRLYVSSGDGTSAASAQDPGSLLGKILRLADDGSVPLDNPFVGVGGAAPEVFALGFRNPWRIAFDETTGELWVADAGADEVEEVDVVVAGGNYGWPVFEGDRSNDNPGGLPPSAFEAPVHVYSSHGGGSIVGGRVYRGSAHPELVGRYVYADWGGSVRALDWNGTSVVSDALVASGVPFPVSFAADEDGELLIACLGDERVHRLAAPAAPPSASMPPALLSQTGLFADLATLAPAAGLIEYDVNAPLWSDGAAKRRWIGVPDAETIGFDATGAWTFPLGTVLVKHFEVTLASQALRRLETRVLVHDASGWQGVTYRWNPGQTDADLLEGSAFESLLVDDGQGGAELRSFYYPSRTDCLACHNAAAGRVLGVRTAQLNRSFDYGPVEDNQLRAWNHVGLFGASIGAAGQHDALADPADPGAGLAPRARAYLEANCAHCHRPGGATGTDLDLRASVDRLAMRAIGVPPTASTLGLPARVEPFARGQSVLWVRMGETNGLRMPALASNAPDALGLALVGDWIDAGAP